MLERVGRVRVVDDHVDAAGALALHAAGHAAHFRQSACRRRIVDAEKTRDADRRQCVLNVEAPRQMQHVRLTVNVEAASLH